mgnify:CR=1 FL=1
MAEVPSSLVDAISRVDAALASSGLPYAFGGALALSAWAEPRATRDIDLNVWVDPGQVTPVLDALETAGVTIDRDRATREAIGRGMFVGFAGEYRVDVFVPSIPFYDEARRRICRVPFLDRTFPVLSPETLAVFKLLFFRPKDLVDLQRLLEIRGSEFDAGFVRAAVAGMLGEDDRRIEEWDGLVRAVSGGPRSG